MTWQQAVLINLDCAPDKMRMRMKTKTKIKTKTKTKKKTVEMLTNSLVKKDKDED